MAYFNHAFQKAFLASGVTQTGYAVTFPDGSTIATTTAGGYVTTEGVPTYGLNQLKANAALTNSSTETGYIGIFDPKTNLTITPEDCCNVYLAGSAIFANDKIGPLAGGYLETNKSKMINPKYVSKYYNVTPCAPQNNVIHVGSTYWTAGGGILTVNGTITGTNTLYATSATGVIAAPVTTTGTGSGLVISYNTTAGGKVAANSVVIINPGKGYAASDTVTIPYADGEAGNAIVTIATVTAAHAQTGCGVDYNCCKEFLCGETYSLRLDIKGSPAMRFLDHNAYYTADAYTGCCPEGAIAPVAVDSTEVMIKWADAITNSPIVSPFVQIVVQDEDGVLWYAPGTSATFLAANDADTWNNYVSGGHTDGACAGLILNGAYVDTKFGDCTFQVTDFYEVEPVRLYASEVDLTGDPCVFDGLCVVTECQGLQVQGLGETILRDLKLSESYRQNFMATDLRIREITQGNQIVSAIDRNELYYRYAILHSVPRFNNPSGVFDNDQYLLEVFSIDPLTQFDTDITDWLSGCGVCDLENNTYGCETACDVPVNFPAIPVYNPYNTIACN
jgi:hypothetical protein